MPSKLSRMRLRIGLVGAFVALSTSTALAAVPPFPADGPPYGVSALVQVRTADGQGAVHVEFYATQNVVGSEHPTELAVVVTRCDSDRCLIAAEQVVPLPKGALKVHPSLRSASLRTSWLGRPLRIDWTANRRDVGLAKGNVAVDLGSRKSVWEDFQHQNATSRVWLLGRSAACPAWELSGMYTATFAQQEPIVAADTGSPSAVPELRARRFPCL